MAFAVNHAVVLGNLGKDPELRYTQGGKAVCSFSVATSEGRDDAKRTEWHNVVAWEKLADLCARLLHKGSKVYVEGRMSTSSWEKDGQKHYRTQIVAREIVFLTASGEPRQDQGQDQGRGYGGQSGGTGAGSPGADEIPYADDEDIPF